MCAGGLEGPHVGKPKVSPQDGSFATHPAHRQERDLNPQFHLMDHAQIDLGLRNFQGRCDWAMSTSGVPGGLPDPEQRCSLGDL